MNPHANLLQTPSHRNRERCLRTGDGIAFQIDRILADRREKTCDLSRVRRGMNRERCNLVEFVPIGL